LPNQGPDSGVEPFRGRPIVRKARALKECFLAPLKELRDASDTQIVQ